MEAKDVESSESYVTVNGDIWHPRTSEGGTSDPALDVIQEDKNLEVSSVEHPQDKSYKMFLPIQKKPRKRNIKRVPAVKTRKGPFELSDD